MTNQAIDPKEALREELRQMIAQGASDEEVIQRKEQGLAEIAKTPPAQDQTDAPAQGLGITDSASGDGSLEQGEPNAFTSQPEELNKPSDIDPQIGAWKNFTNNIENTWTRILGFDDRLNLASADIYEALLGKEGANAFMESVGAGWDDDGNKIKDNDELREIAYQGLAASEAAQKQTIGLQDAWETGDPALFVSAVAGTGLNVLSTNGNVSTYFRCWSIY